MIAMNNYYLCKQIKYTRKKIDKPYTHRTFPGSRFDNEPVNRELEITRQNKCTKRTLTLAKYAIKR